MTDSDPATDWTPSPTRQLTDAERLAMARALHEARQLHREHFEQETEKSA